MLSTNERSGKGKGKGRGRGREPERARHKVVLPSGRDLRRWSCSVDYKETRVAIKKMACLKGVYMS